MRMRAEMYSRMVIVGLAAGSLLCGCHKTALVYGPSALPNALAPGDINNNDKKAAAAKNQLPGIPFYNHYGVCTQEEVWLEPQTTISLTVTADGGKPVTQTITLNNAAFHDSSPDGHDANSLLTRLEEAAGSHSNEITDQDKKFCPANVGESWRAVRDYYKVPPIDDASSSDITTNVDKKILVRISNTADIGTAVDYSRVYYLNSQSPLIGTGSVDAHINSDGTLGEGSASVDDETLGDVLSAAATVGSGGLTAWSTVAAAHIAGAATQAADLVNANAILADGAAPKPPVDQPPACEAGDGWPQVKKTVSYELRVTPSGYKHDHKIVKPLENGQCRVTDPVMDGSYTISPVGGDGGKADKDAIGVSGTITLPKAKDAAPPKQ